MHFSELIPIVRQHMTVEGCIHRSLFEIVILVRGYKQDNYRIFR